MFVISIEAMIYLWYIIFMIVPLMLALSTEISTPLQKFRFRPWNLSSIENDFPKLLKWEEE